MYYILIFILWHIGLPGGASGKEPAYQCRRHNRLGFNPWVRKIPWRRARQLTPVVLPGESHGQRTLVGSSPWGRKESEMTEVTWHTLWYIYIYIYIYVCICVCVYIYIFWSGSTVKFVYSSAVNLPSIVFLTNSVFIHLWCSSLPKCISISCITQK